MPVIRRRNANDHPHEAPDVNDWARQLPPDAAIHVKEGSAYIDSFPAHEAQDDATVEEILLARYGVGTYELAGRHNGLFLPGREKVHVGSQADRQAARHAQVTRDSQATGGDVGDVAQVVGMLKDLGWTPGGQANQENSELTNMLVQHAVQSLRPPDPGQTMREAFEIIKTAQDIQRDSAPPPRPRQKRRRKKKGASDMSDESNFMGASGITGMAGAAALAGLDFAMQRPDVAQRMSDGISAKAHSAVGWFQRKIQGHAQAPVGETGEGGTGEDGATPTGDSPAVTLEQAIEGAKTMLATPIGQRMVDYVRGSVHDLAPEEIARHGLEGARQWLGPDHPLLLRLHENPGRVFDEMAEIVGLTGDLWWKARSHFVDAMADETAETSETPTSSSTPEAAHEAEGQHAEAARATGVEDEPGTPEEGDGASDDGANAKVDPDDEEG